MVKLTILALLLELLSGCTSAGQFLQGFGQATNPYYQYQYQYYQPIRQINCTSTQIGSYTYTNCY